MSEVGDWDLVARARSGDTAAFAELVRRYQTPVIHFCLRMTGSIQDAEELAQDTFVRVHRYLARLTPRARFSTLLFGVARNLTLNFLRDAKRRGRGRTLPLDAAAGRFIRVSADGRFAHVFPGSASPSFGFSRSPRPSNGRKSKDGSVLLSRL